MEQISYLCCSEHLWRKKRDEKPTDYVKGLGKATDISNHIKHRVGAPLILFDSIYKPECSLEVGGRIKIPYVHLCHCFLWEPRPILYLKLVGYLEQAIVEDGDVIVEMYFAARIFVFVDLLVEYVVAYSLDRIFVVFAIEERISHESDNHMAGKVSLDL